MYINIKFKNPEIFSFLFSLYLFSQINKTERKYNDDSKTKVCKKKKKGSLLISSSALYGFGLASNI